MNLDQYLPPRDPEFGSHRPGMLDRSLGGEPENYLRLIANPFFGFLYIDAWLVLMYESVVGGFAGPLTPMLLVVNIFALGFVPLLLQFHCLDCGRTGRLLRWRKHQCPMAQMRKDAGQKRRIHGPTPPVQVVLWIWVLIGSAVVLNSMQLLGRFR